MPPTARASWRRAPSTHRRGRGGRGGARAAPTPRLTTSSPSPAARRGRGRGAGAAGRGARAPPNAQLLYSTILDETLFCKSEAATPPADCRRRPGAAAWCAACWRHGAPHPAPHRCPYQDCLGCWMCAEGSPYPRLLRQHGVDRLCAVRLQRLVAPAPSPAQPTPAPVNTGRKRFRMRLEPRPEDQDPVQDDVNGAADTTSSHGDTDFTPYEIHDDPGQNQHDTSPWDYTEHEPDKQDDVHEERQSTPLEPLTVETDLEQVSKPAVEAALCALESPLPPKPKAARVLGPVKVRRRSGERDPPYLSWMCAPLGQRAWAGAGPRAWAGAWAGPKSISVTPHGVYVVFKSKRSSSGPSLRRSRPFTAGKPSPKSIRGSPIKAEPMSPPRGDRSPSKSVVKVETGTRRSALLHRRRLEVFSFSADDDLEEDGPPARECVRPQPRCVRCHVHGQGLLVRRHKPDRCPNRRCTCENCSEFKFERPSRGRARRAKAERKAADKARAGQVAAQEARPGGAELQQVAATTQTQFNPLPTGIDTKDMLPQEPAVDIGAAVEANLRTGAALTTSEAVAEQVASPLCAVLAEEDAGDVGLFGPATMVDAAAGGSPPSGDDDEEEDGEPLEDCMVAYMCTDDDALEVEAFGCAWCGREFPTEEEAERHALRHAEDDVDVDEMEIKEEVEEKYEDVAVWDACAGLSVFSPSPPGSPSATIKSSPGTPPSSTPTTAATRSPALTSPAATRTPTRTSPASTGTPAPTSPAANRTPTPTSPAATRTPAPTSPSATREPAPTSPAATSAPVARPAAKVTPPTSPPATRSLLPASAMSEAPPSAGPTSAAAKSSSKAVVAVAAVGVRPAAGARPVVRTERQPPVVFKCLDCHDEFGSRVELARHRLGRHSHEQWYRCATCDSSFHTERMRAVHMAVMHPARVFACEACPARLLSRLAVQLHMLDAHGAAPEDGLHCQCCPHRLFSAQHLFDHVRDLHRGRCFPCACPTCGESPHRPVGSTIVAPRSSLV
ncbi:uncharacterized protein LOC113213741 [Frankliniella occidentalis]|uniref:Uncharacterized protein LOC113213741 n=1 Tax=Frankliniella occidentalis TaxID=133901 RepID=A0A9C6WUB1_FRAOC|nr:uncharacterized protein LOC113213741 [Frankliniella occidentalis]XP_052121275.1 uncharacterized protein LOC113213741 [Frankliniella occidentalis]XP_052121276.1 uncharacterized protein LOC113213741 [Frankliniella occidentalis]